MHHYSESSLFSPTSSLLLTTSVLLMLGGCSILQNLSDRVQKPTLSVENVRISGFTFTEMELIYDIKVENPNPMAVEMLAYDYNLKIDDHSLVKGEQAEKLKIQASGESIFQVPMTLNFPDIYQTVKGLGKADEASYRFLSNLTFQLPVLGRTTLPVSKRGNLPLLKRPSVRFKNVEVEQASLSGAKINLQLGFENPNGFGIKIGALDYTLRIDGTRWAEGIALKGTNIKKNSETLLNIPLTLNLSNMGMSAYRILTGSREFNYQLDGRFKLDLGHKLLGQTSLEFNRSGQLSLSGN